MISTYTFNRHKESSRFRASSRKRKLSYTFASVAFLLASAGTNILSITAASATGAWGSAIELPGTASLNTGGNAVVDSISCSTSGYCGAIGNYTDSSNHVQDFVENETNGTWGAAIEIPGFASLSSGGVTSQLNPSISCTSAGNCSAGGTYGDSSGTAQGFLVNETNGTWGTAIEVPGLTSLGTQALSAQVTTMSCSSTGNCVAGGFDIGSGTAQAFVINEAKGTWGNAIQIPGTAGFNANDVAGVASIACPSNGNCSAAGFYEDAANEVQTFVASETNNVWGTAIPLPGLVGLNSAGNAVPNQIACTSTGNCSTGGYYSDTSAGNQAFVANETNGTWGTAIEVPGTAVLNVADNAQVDSIACSSSGNCAAGGYYSDTTATNQAFVVNETNGTWSTAIEVPGTAALNVANLAIVASVACISNGNCVAGGYYDNSTTSSQAFVVNEAKGTWGTAIEAPGTATLNAGGGAAVVTVACEANGSCDAAGGYSDSSGNGQAFAESSAADIFAPGSPSISATSSTSGVVIVKVRGSVSDGGSAITGYQYSLNGGAWSKVSTAASFKISHLAVGKIERVRVRAINNVGSGKISKQESVTVA
jgi:hypothetical protein